MVAEFKFPKSDYAYEAEDRIKAKLGSYPIERLSTTDQSFAGAGYLKVEIRDGYPEEFRKACRIAEACGGEML